MMASSGLVGSSLLDKIDRLFECNVGDSVALPQIVVVGDQSSGKSSVLEGLMGLPFPRESGLCTRFATQITFRRSTESQITVSIIPAKNSKPEDRERLQEWKKSSFKSLDSGSFANIMAEVLHPILDYQFTNNIQVKNVMGVEPTEGQPRKTFSNDVLQLEITGPDQEHFSVIDVPGIFKRTTHGLTTKEDMIMVNNMANEYMSNPRSVMLTKILERAEDLDPEGIRTFGILTKPDLVDKGGNCNN
ncbi:hypothetical protein K469DRAFT_795889 [Zopfia rhizophila CBS 207.26]|uniref:Dynamin GTPase domain-containing protein n=1 Tax=Zopfia rhizophila CBS 207.26 TaxID=1314779 RepID=A0A6A6ER23_9PEZI|nr:hypothetical protein K469DRAFT_795889 [Zopfia rhizophila CBS 207.26]